MPTGDPWYNENALAGLSPNPNSFIQAGISNTDSPTDHPEDVLTLPWLIDPVASWLAYTCTLETHLDAGIALHRPLPQRSGQTDRVDTLTSSYVDDYDADTTVDRGVNTISTGKFTDVVQRMAPSLYRFCLRGWGLRMGYQIPIPGLRSVAGVDATPAERQMAFNEIIANYSGIPLWYAQWELWYYVTVPPTVNVLPPPNVAEHIRADVELPMGLPVPQGVSDYNAVAGPVGGGIGTGIPGT